MDRTALEDLEDFLEQEHAIRAETVEASAEAARTIDTIEALEALQEVVARKPQISVEAFEAGNMARAFAATGTGQQGSNIVPYFQEGESTEVALESLNAKIREGIVSLTDSTGVMLNNTLRHAVGYDIVLSALTKRVTELTRRLDQMENAEGTFKIKVTLETDEPITAKDLVARLEDEQAMLQQIHERFRMTSEKLSDSFTEMIKSMILPNKSYFDAVINQFNYFNNDALVNFVSANAFQHKSVARHSGQVRPYVYTTVPFIGDQELSVRLYDGQDFPMSAGRTAVRKAIENIGFSHRSASARKDQSTSSQVVVFDRADLITLRRAMTSLSKTVTSMSLHNHDNILNLRVWIDQQKKSRHWAGVIGGVAAGSAIGLDLSKIAVSLLKSTKAVAPVSVAPHILSAVAGGALGGIVVHGGLSALDWIRQTVISFMFTGMKLQYKMADYLNWYSNHVIDVTIDNIKVCVDILEKGTKD